MLRRSCRRAAAARCGWPTWATGPCTATRRCTPSSSAGCWKRGEYVYDPHEYHGPSLNYLTLPVARLASAEKLTEITEVHLRLVPALFGIAAGRAGLAAARRAGPRRPPAAPPLLTAVSPAMVFYSRYYIQEMLLVCFTFGAIVALWRFAPADGRAGGRPERATPACAVHAAAAGVWLLCCSACRIGMMHASKETCVIALFAMAVAAAVTMPRL